MARYGHMLALSWNIGEENVQQPGDIRHMINYIASHNIYDHPIVLHSYPDQKERYSWANIVELTGKRLVLAYDEPGRADGGATVDADYPDTLLPSKREVTIPSETFLRDGLWSALTAGANGVEAYYGYKTGCSDLDCQDHRTRAQLWKGGRHALNFCGRVI